MDNNINAANAATDAQRAADEQQAIAKLVGVATKVAADIKQLGLHGKGVRGAKNRCNTINLSTDATERLKAARELAASLRKGNAEAHKFADEIDDVLQLRLPGMEDGPAADGGSQVQATQAPEPPSAAAESTPVEIGPNEARAPTPAFAAAPMPIADLRTAEPFSTLFPINGKTQDAIVTNIQVNGFDPAQPVVVWHGRNVVVDGHTRLEAAKQAGLVEIPVVLRDFADEDTALQYAINAQKNRRNLTDAEILRLVELLDSRRKRGGDRRSDEARSTAPNGAIENAKRSSEETAQKIGISPRKVERARQIIDKAAPQTLEAVKSGELTINKAAGAISESGQAGGNPGITLAAKRAVKQLHAIEADLKNHGNVFGRALAQLNELIAEIGKASDAAAQ